MSLLLSAAETWDSLTETTYQLIIGRKSETKRLRLQFRPIDFDHLSGIHYANDVDFKLHRNEYRGDRLISALKTGRLDGSLIEKSRDWVKISSRLRIILSLRDILDSDFELYRFSAKKLPVYSKIQAEYLLYSEEVKNGIFLFFDRESQTYYCKSIFERGESDYRANQTRWTLLQNSKCCDGQVRVLFRHPNYKESWGHII